MRHECHEGAALDPVINTFGPPLAPLWRLQIMHKVPLGLEPLVNRPPSALNLCGEGTPT